LRETGKKKEKEAQVGTINVVVGESKGVKRSRTRAGRR